MGLFAQINILKDRPFFGIPAEKCTWIKGRCITDGARITDDLVGIRLRMAETGDRNGARVTASGTIQLFLRTERTPYWGEEIIVTGNPAFDDESGAVMFYGSLGKERAITFTSGFLKWRAAVIEGLTKKIDSMGEKTGGFFKALFLGVKDDLGLREREQFRKAGSMHILALSGMHLAVLSGFLFFLFKPLTGKGVSFWIVAFCIGFYIFVTGARSSLLRAGIMFAVYGAGLFFGKKGDIRAVFLLSFLVLLVITPLAVRTLSFQLSFLALAGILYLGSRIMHGTRRFLPGFLRVPISASIGAQCATAPLLSLLFGAVYPAGILASLLLTPLVSLFLLIGIIYLAVPVAALQSAVLYPMEKLYHSIMWIASYGARVPGLETSKKGEIVVIFIVCTFVCLGIIIPYAVRKHKQWHRLITTVFRK